MAQVRGAGNLIRHYLRPELTRLDGSLHCNHSHPALECHCQEPFRRFLGIDQKTHPPDSPAKGGATRVTFVRTSRMLRADMSAAAAIHSVLSIELQPLGRFGISCFARQLSNSTRSIS